MGRKDDGQAERTVERQRKEARYAPLHGGILLLLLFPVAAAAAAATFIFIIAAALFHICEIKNGFPK